MEENHAVQPLNSTAQTDRAQKAPWHPPTFEEVDYSETESGGSGAVYDFIVYNGSV